MTMTLWVLGALGFVLVLLVSVALHELGHLSVAKAFKLKVPEYFVGFGKTLYSRKINGTEYGVKAIPLGGYVRIQDPKSDDPESDESQLLSNVAPWKRTLVFLAGPVVNIVIGTVLFFFLFLSTTVALPTNSVGMVTQCSDEVKACGAFDGGIRSGDKITEINGVPVDNGGIPVGAVTDDKPITVKYERDGIERSTQVTPVYDETSGRYLIGVQMKAEEGNLTVVQSVEATKNIYVRNFEAIAALPSKVPELIRVIGGGERSEETPVSVVGITKISGDVAADQTIQTNDKWFTFLSLAASFNLGIGLINLIPLVPLDGGRILVAGLDSIKRLICRIRRVEYQPIGAKFVNGFTMAALFLVILPFFLLAIAADIINPISLK